MPCSVTTVYCTAHAVPLGIIVVENNADLETVREQINKLHLVDYQNEAGCQGASSVPLKQLSEKWSFLDSTTAERFFRIDRSQESLHYITDISSEDLYILDPELSSRLQSTLGVTGPILTLDGHGDLTPSAFSVRSLLSPSPSAMSFTFPVTPPKSPTVLKCPDFPTIQLPEGEVNLLMPPQPGGNNRPCEPGTPMPGGYQPRRKYSLIAIPQICTEDDDSQGGAIPRITSPLEKSRPPTTFTAYSARHSNHWNQLFPLSEEKGSELFDTF
ncbi:hypothetical protein ACOMHN_046067 [Nucella lapillus]